VAALPAGATADGGSPGGGASDEKVQRLISTCSYWASVLQAGQQAA